MKNIYYLILLSLSLFATPPNWYINNSISSKEFEIIGYGEAKTQAEAKRIAREDIANSIQITVQSDFQSSKSDIDGVYKKNIISNSKQTTEKVNLINVKIIKSDYKDGIYYIAYKYINLPFSQRVRYAFKQIQNIRKETNQYLIQTPLLKELKNEFGFYPKIKIDRDNLIIKDKSFKINNFILKKLFVSISNNNLKLNIPTNLKDKEYYFINLKSKKSGYLTLAQIYANGEVSVLFSNKEIKKNTSLEYPNSEEYDGIEVFLNKDINQTNDLAISILCKNKRNFDYFDRISRDKEIFAKLYGKLFNMIDGCIFTSQIIKIKR
jgi:hypothetical protein